MKATAASDTNQSYELILYLNFFLQYSLLFIIPFGFRWIFAPFSLFLSLFYVSVSLSLSLFLPLSVCLSLSLSLSFCWRSVTVDSLAEITRTCFGHYLLLGWKMFSMDNSHRFVPARLTCRRRNATLFKQDWREIYEKRLNHSFNSIVRCGLWFINELVSKYLTL